MNNQSLDSELKKIQALFTNTEKHLNKILIQIIKDSNIFNQIKKQIKKIETILDKDLININDNNYEQIMNKAKIEGGKYQSLIDEFSNNNNNINNNALIIVQNSNENILNKNSSNKSLSNNNINLTEIINKINDNIQENKISAINYINMISKLYFKYIDLYKKYKTNTIEYEKNNILRNQKNIKNEENLKNNIITLTNDNINKFTSMCYNSNTNDLKNELKNLNQNANSMNSSDVLKIALDILSKLLLRTSSYKDEKELEIENLNGKIIYLLSELDIYKRNVNINKDNKDNNNNKSEIQLLNNQLGLKEDEINRLNKDIEEYLTKIKELSCENNLLKNNNKIKNNYNKINNIEEINTKYKNINNYIKKNNNDNDSENLSEKGLENDLAKNQDDIDKINAQLRELSQLENK